MSITLYENTSIKFTVTLNTVAAHIFHHFSPNEDFARNISNGHCKKFRGKTLDSEKG
jgi:hypothetical protein